MPDVSLDPKRTALLLQDLQNELVKGDTPVVPGSGAEIIANCRKLRDKAREVGMPVIHVRVSRRSDGRDVPLPPLGAPTGGAGGPKLVEGTHDSEIVSELSPTPEEVVVDKHTTSPFNTTDIEVYLRRFGVDTLILTGYSTTGVVEGSLRDARDKDYHCVVVRDCCGARTLQEHDACMDIVFPRMAWVAGVDAVIEAIKGQE